MIEGALRLLGVEPREWRALHDAFWQLSRRRATGLRGLRTSEGASLGHGATLLTYACIGLFLTVPAFAIPTRDGYSTVVLGAGLFMLVLSAVSDFSTVIVAPGDDEILFHLPIRSRSYLAARLTVATKHLAIQALPLAVAPAIAAALRWRSPFEVVLLPAAMLWVAAFALLLSFGLHRILLRWLGGPRLRALLAYVPAFASLLIAFGPQLLPTLLGRSGVDHRTSTAPLDAWTLALPPAWFSGLVEALQGNATTSVLTRAAIGLLVVPVGAVLVVGWLSHGFLGELLRLLADRDAGVAPARTGRLGPGPLTVRLFGLRSSDARAGWLLHAGAMRSRDARARAFAALAPPLVFCFIGAIQRSSPFRPEFVGFFSGASLAGLVGLWPYHEHREGAWIYEAVGPRLYGHFLRGVLARTILRAGGLLLVAVIVSATVRGPNLFDLLSALAAASAGLLPLPVSLSIDQPPPFSCAARAGAATTNPWTRVVFLILSGVAATAVAVLGHHWPWTFAVTIPAALAIAVLGSVAALATLDRRPPPALRPERSPTKKFDPSMWSSRT